MLMGIERIILHAPANQPPPPRCRHEEEGASASVPDTNDSAAMIGGTSGSGTKMMDPSSAVEDGHHDDDDEDRATARVRRQGRVDGLFRACMDVIRSSHTLGRALRTAMLAAGLMTDRYCYAELLGQFYVVTSALETRMEELHRELDDDGAASSSSSSSSSSSFVARARTSLGYSFASGYESDLRHLLGPDWRSTTESWTTDPAARYARRLRAANEDECAAAVFILHGPLVIGGGAALRPRVERAFGAGATNVFEGVCGIDERGRGRSGRRREFIEFYDALLDGDDADHRDVRFVTIVRSCSEFMDMNNEMMTAVRRAPWWKKYAVACSVAAVSVFSVLAWRFIVYVFDGDARARSLK